jgi:hypothetical protein
MMCPACGASLSQVSAFCPFCHQPLSTGEGQKGAFTPRQFHLPQGQKSSLLRGKVRLSSASDLSAQGEQEPPLALPQTGALQGQTGGFRGNEQQDATQASFPQAPFASGPVPWQKANTHTSQGNRQSNPVQPETTQQNTQHWETSWQKPAVPQSPAQDSQRLWEASWQNQLGSPTPAQESAQSWEKNWQRQPGAFSPVQESQRSWERSPGAASFSSRILPTPTNKPLSSFALVGIVCALLVLLVGGSVVAVLFWNQQHATSKTPTTPITQGSSAVATTQVTSSPTTAATTVPAPSGKSINPTVAALFSNIRTSSSIDDKYQPTNVTNTFAVKQNVYITFVISSKNQPGYIQVLWYSDNTMLIKDQLTHDAQHNVGYFGIIYQRAANAAAELYWCTKSDCSDAQLASVVRFTVA